MDERGNKNALSGGHKVMPDNFIAFEIMEEYAINEKSPETGIARTFSLLFGEQRRESERVRERYAYQFVHWKQFIRRFFVFFFFILFCYGSIIVVESIYARFFFLFKMCDSQRYHVCLKIGIFTKQTLSPRNKIERNTNENNNKNNSSI